jgi:transposase
MLTPVGPGLVRDVLKRESIERMYCPDHSRDLNPIEHMWNEMQVRISVATQNHPIA